MSISSPQSSNICDSCCYVSVSILTFHGGGRSSTFEKKGGGGGRKNKRKNPPGHLVNKLARLYFFPPPPPPSGASGRRNRLKNEQSERQAESNNNRGFWDLNGGGGFGDEKSGNGEIRGGRERCKWENKKGVRTGGRGKPIDHQKRTPLGSMDVRKPRLWGLHPQKSPLGLSLTHLFWRILSSGYYYYYLNEK